MKTILSKINKFGLMAFVLGLMLIGTQSAFKGAKTVAKSPLDNTRQWYSLDPTSNTNPANQDITGFSGVPEEEDSEGCAQFENDGDFCSVLLEFPNEDPAPDLENTTVQAALTNGAIIVDTEATNGYALLPDAK